MIGVLATRNNVKVKIETCCLLLCRQEVNQQFSSIDLLNVKLHVHVYKS